MNIFKSKEKKWVIPDKNSILIAAVLLLQFYQISNQTYSNYQLKKDPTVRVGDTPEDFCHYTVKSIIEGNFSWKMFDEVTFKGLKADPNFFEFRDDEKVQQVKVVGDQCRVLTVSDGKMRGLLITLNESVDNPLYYKAIQINEEDEPAQVVNN